MSSAPRADYATLSMLAERSWRYQKIDGGVLPPPHDRLKKKKKKKKKKNTLR
eukprot:NODE_30628_length_414_cov_0.637631.p3 GENE.NODE_30628_length_414_cov_0.637631~~NODE_30628_length_414_cov_0.637631.p3  ORF type:complete len:52 (-),score=30.03 NODE_30628_length_414_cov_0.637631:187-342(-)